VITPCGGGGGGGGIQFDTDNQGGYLFVTTNAAVPGFTSGMVLQDSQDGGGVGIRSTGADGLVLIEAGDGTTTGGRVDIAAYDEGGASGGINITADGTALIQAVTGVQVQATNGDVRLRLADGWSLTAESHTNVILVEVQEGGPGWVVRVKNAAGAPIFRIDLDGALHGKTGQALTFDL
jgi:hypothetical protein